MTIAVEDLALVHPLQAFTPVFKPQSAIVVPAEIANIKDQLPELDPLSSEHEGDVGPWAFGDSHSCIS